jgi:hypothetical protein
MRRAVEKRLTRRVDFDGGHEVTYPCDAAVEDRLRTYIAAGVSPADLEG